MKINFKKSLAGLLVFGIFVGPLGKAYASEDTGAVFEILSSEKASEGLDSEEKADEAVSSSEKADETKEDGAKDSPKGEALSENEDKADDLSLDEALFDLYVKIATARHTGSIDVSDYVRVINLRSSDLADINKARASLGRLLDQSGEKVALDMDTEAVKAEIADLINYGRVLFADLLDGKSLDDLHVAYEAVINSKAYKNATGEAKNAYNKTLTEVYELINDLDKKTETSDEDRAKIKAYADKLADLGKKAKDSKDKGSENNDLVTESKTLKNKNYLSNANELKVGEEESIDEDSPFFKSEKTKEAYKALTPEERKKLDEINTTKDDVITKEELDADGNYTKESPWLKPFLAKVEGSSQERPSSETSTSTTTVTPSTPSTTTTTPTSPASGTPETVTISSTSNPTDKEDGDVKTNTYSSQNAKTGIQGIGFVGIILVVAVIGFGVVTYMKKNDKK